jgi:hypothetical protein
MHTHRIVKEAVLSEPDEMRSDRHPRFPALRMIRIIV